MRLTIELEQEDDGRWIAEIPELPGVMVYGRRKPPLRSTRGRSRSACSLIVWKRARLTSTP